MIRVRGFEKGVRKREFIIYSSYDEAMRDGIRVVYNPVELKPGDYFFFDNGYVAPCTSSHLYTRGNHVFLTIRFPLKNSISIYTDGKQQIRNKLILFHRFGVFDEKARMGLRDKLVLQLWSEGGWDIIDAWLYVFKPRMPMKSVEKVISNFFNSKSVKYYMKEHNIMQNMKTAAQGIGADRDWLLKQVKSIIEDPKASASLREKCIDRMFTILDDYTESGTTPANKLEGVKSRAKALLGSGLQA